MHYLICSTLVFFSIVAVAGTEIGTASAEQRVALVVGIDKYDNLPAGSQLRKAKSDAAAVARTFRQLGFDVIAKDDVTRSAFNGHWQDFLNKLKPGDTAAFYFAGHGVELGGRTYLLPRDVPGLKPGRDELLRREALSLYEFLADLKEKGTRLNVVILDACRDNPFEQLEGRTVGGRRGLSVVEPPEGTFIMYSAGSGESALDRLGDKDNDPNSVYTRHLLPLLLAPGLSLTDVAEQVRVSVHRTAATVRHRQTPAYYNQVLGKVCLAGGDCSPRVIAPPAAGQAIEAERAWLLVKDTTGIPALEAFIRRFGDTYYGDLAKVRLAELREADAAKLAKAGAQGNEDRTSKKEQVASAKAEQDSKDPGAHASAPAPLTMIQDVYSKLQFNHLFEADNPAHVAGEPSELTRSYFTPQFIALLRKNGECWGTPGKEGHQIWVAGQDIGISGLKLTVVDRTSTTQTVLVNLRNFTDDQIWAYRFRLFPRGWLIEDVLFHGQSLAKSIAAGCLA